MEIKFQKKMDLLEKEVILKSVELDDDIEDFKVDIGDFQSKERFIAISPRCVRCNLCVEECPVGAISDSTYSKRARILDNCVKCEICVETCPISSIYIFESEAIINNEAEEIKDQTIDYTFNEFNIPHRVIRLNNIEMDRSKCIGCRHCVKFCPTNANKLKSKSYIEDVESQNYDTLIEGELYPIINKDLCLGCGSCVNICAQDVYILDRYLGPVIPTKNLIIDEDTCVSCFLCEENCPTNAIVLNSNNIPELDDDKCIRCNVCTMKCPVGALNFEDVEFNYD
ncbi:4Fe-4S binding protein [uncultured Methanobrevibacter sp.]|uniref:4Fe-4S binding protein n=1 Tax=uncultured Methanobrevibacter sp. TaxID=253161 RepID=UPI0025EB7BED|nr:4Fe-4S binding protein [uncultured Methanobrevibacter sp.]